MLQGGGALGAYQAGVYQALHEAGIEPDWVSGVSIGAINAAIIAGNLPERALERLRDFWERITERKVWQLYAGRRHLPPGAQRHAARWLTIALWPARLLRAAQRRALAEPAGAKTATSYYDSAPLRETLRSWSIST